ncbi:DUF2971 domain-containing protein [Candidatus Colwellia aromaticivorans]|uniref:DUF2971 domain-containing protein n=1 Tax=Candidatus Colwellia aromaticivorans TaxID=2267621 RepID=UPI000DF4566A|nr:DUF2971 domain-containing protein [Candidatus Colwellia aromaticivorans]
MTSIYKYTQYRPDFFENFFLKISRFGEFNDPFEMVMGNYLSSVSQEEHDEIMSLSHRLSDGASYNYAAWDAECGVRASVGVLCFASKKDNLLMWSHYANDHAGICIELDANAEFFNGEYTDAPSKIFDDFSPDYSHKDCYENIGVIKPVDYTIERPKYIEPQELEYNTESWFVKSPEWSYEEEQRLLLPIDHAEMVETQDSTLFFYPIEPSIIKSVIVGCQMPTNIKKEVYIKCKALGIQVKEAFVHSHQFKLDIIDYDESNHSSYRNMYNLNRITN